uniref:Uncharacterized protein n=1 Tax=Arundo donax TaxID=35708 RepID=A0A0A8Z7C3_ARUDO
MFFKFSFQHQTMQQRMKHSFMD